MSCLKWDSSTAQGRLETPCETDASWTDRCYLADTDYSSAIINLNVKNKFEGLKKRTSFSEY